MFYTLTGAYDSDKTRVFDQSERAQGPIYNLNSENMFFDQLQREQGPI